jgi:hypothetical protein
MPVASATPLTVRYRKIVTWGLAPSAIRFASAALMGHRVSVVMPVDLMNRYFTWTRASGSLGPIGHFDSDASGEEHEAFAVVLERALGGGFTDADAVANGLNFSSSALEKEGVDIMRSDCVYNVQTSLSGAPTQPGEAHDASGNPMSSTHYGANDLVMAWVMFKCFGSSAYDPTDVIYNIDDGYNMLSSEELANAIEASLSEQEALVTDASDAEAVPATQLGLVHEMFLKFLATDPKRYFENGVQIPGLFETNFVCGEGDPAGAGNWCLTVGDRIEIPLRLVFRAPVSVLSVQDTTRLASSETPEKPETVYIEGEAADSAAFDGSGNFQLDASGADAYNMANVIPLRLQLVCGPPIGTTGSGSTSQSAASLPLQLALSNNLVFYTPATYGEQTAIGVVAAGGTAPLAYAIDATGSTLPMDASGTDLVINATTGILTYYANTQTALEAVGTYDLKINVTDASTGSVSKTIKVTLAKGSL